MKKLLCAGVLYCLVIGCATNAQSAASTENTAGNEENLPTERTIVGTFTATIGQSSLPREYRPVPVATTSKSQAPAASASEPQVPVPVVTAPEPQAPAASAPKSNGLEFSAQWLGTDKSVVSQVFGEPEYKIPYPNGFTEECWFYPIRKTKWFIFIDTLSNKVIDIQYQNPGQPMMTTGTRLPASGNPLHAPIPKPEEAQSPVPSGYKPYQSFKY